MHKYGGLYYLKGAKMDKSVYCFCIGPEGTLIMNYLMELAVAGNDYAKLANSTTFMPLVVELIAEGEISLCHYGKMNGDLMRDPEVVFSIKNDKFYPNYFRNDYMGIEQFVWRGEANAVELQYDLVEFAEMWLKNIVDQQELEISCSVEE